MVLTFLSVTVPVGTQDPTARREVYVAIILCTHQEHTTCSTGSMKHARTASTYVTVCH